jgi:hypothetical protein
MFGLILQLVEICVNLSRPSEKAENRAIVLADRRSDGPGRRKSRLLF